MRRRVLIGIGLVAVSGATLIACVWLASTVGQLSIIALSVLSGMAAWAANETARGIAADAYGAVWDSGLTLKEAAARVGLDMAAASRQLTGVERFDYARWATLPGFEAAFAKRRAARSHTYTVIEDGLIERALSTLTRLLDGEVRA